MLIESSPAWLLSAVFDRRESGMSVVSAIQEWSPSHNLKSLRKKQLATREAMARQTVVSDAELGAVESSVIRYYVLFPVGVPLCCPRPGRVPGRHYRGRLW